MDANYGGCPKPYRHYGSALDAGASIEATANEGQTALMIAAEYSAARAVALLLKRGANVNTADNSSRTVGIRAAGHDLIQLMLNGNKSTRNGQQT